MTPARGLQLGALALLWMQLVVEAQLQPMLVWLLPGLIALTWRQPKLSKTQLLGITSVSLLLWGAGGSLADRSSWLQSICNLLWLLTGLKLVEASSHRDQQRCGLLLLLAVGLASLGSQELAASLGHGLIALMALASLLSLEAKPQPLSATLKRTAVLAGLALPVLIVAFLLLPRLEPLWSLQFGQAGRSGLGQRLAPGELASLVQDDSLAARVSFINSSPPPPPQRYWRVLVHQHFDGTSWSGQTAPAQTFVVNGRSGATPGSQSWLVEPTGLRQRPWNGLSRPSQTSLAITNLGTLMARSPLQERSLYTLNNGSGPAIWQQIPPTNADLDLPASEPNPRLLALGKRWQRQGATPEQRLRLAYEWFQQQSFRYTLEPGLLGPVDPLDRFLFETQAGFCEHFAASFSALMRAADVPARVVVGYQGGTWQQPIGSGGYLELRNSDAHAWSEIWLPNRGWVGVDPTAWVVPERVRRSLADSLNANDRQRLRGLPPGWINAAIQQWEGLDYRWQLWVMGYDRQRQLEWLGSGPWQGFTALAAMTAALALGLGPLLLQWRRSPHADAARRQLNLVLRLLQRRGHQLNSGETLPSFVQRVGRSEPQGAASLQAFCDLYDQWRFASPDAAIQRRALLDRMVHWRSRLRKDLEHARRPKASI